MPVLSCNATNCVHNMSGLCSANNVSVVGMDARSSLSTNCETFAEQGLKNALANITNFNVPGQMMQVFNSKSIAMTPEVRCQAVKCRYNQGQICTAENVVVTGVGALTSSRTHCETFVE